MTIKEWVQLAFGLCNGLSFALTIRHHPWAKILGSAVLMVAHPGVAVYFVWTDQPVFLLGNGIMFCAGVYGVIRGARVLRALKKARRGERMTDKQRQSLVTATMPETGGGPL